VDTARDANDNTTWIGSESATEKVSQVKSYKRVCHTNKEFTKLRTGKENVAVRVAGRSDTDNIQC